MRAIYCDGRPEGVYRLEKHEGEFYWIFKYSFGTEKKLILNLTQDRNIYALRSNSDYYLCGKLFFKEEDLEAPETINCS